jgi:hypothetical protein
MKTQQMILVDRRQRPRDGVIAEIENLAYNVLRRYGVNGAAEQDSPTSMEKTA